ncbi:Sir2 family NAD-dependent protein deacetylase [Thalassotalea sp. 1_MG-2023]|uniref:SIR2 family NAD-dependent protein deacylase n=1 Tax=Thalassotalea sp. 1_MG-2023 TaxID=3062680 RepID=UPI0026E42678|nr:Sir2 family NAD-dependent protein deacetylase [Thalassotalea sp. 1_MG-2023]MDO6428713.1 Sir2 family NAD-dependent protein deacetylase [Thalassotalea sp. 1_MG-2023]
MVNTKKKIVLLSGAGMSAESGINTFRDADGLWEGHDVMSVASIEGWYQNQPLVLNFYNQRRKQLNQVSPNEGHVALAKAQQCADISIITQNVDDLHERAGSNNVIHLHGELRKAQSTLYPEYVCPWDGDIQLGDVCPQGAQLRPFIVWFGEDVPMLNQAIVQIASADVVIVVGTSMQVYPAANLVSFAPEEAEIFYLDPKPQLNNALKARKNLTVIEQTAAVGLPTLLATILQ